MLGVHFVTMECSSFSIAHDEERVVRMLHTLTLGVRSQTLFAMILKASPQALGTQAKEKDSAARMKKFMTMMDSMTNKELDSSDAKLWQVESRIMRIARGAGVHPNYVGELIGCPSNLQSCLAAPLCPSPCPQNMLGGCLMSEQQLFYSCSALCLQLALQATALSSSVEPV